MSDAAQNSATTRRIYLDIQSKDKKVPCLTLVDAQVEHNYMSYGTWILLKEPPLDISPKSMTTYTNSRGECIGVTETYLSIGSQLVACHFHVMAPTTLKEDLILGIYWMKVHNYSITYNSIDMLVPTNKDHKDCTLSTYESSKKPVTLDKGKANLNEQLPNDCTLSTDESSKKLVTLDKGKANLNKQLPK
ncbi:hypothetical protein GOP47_0031208, partial [Adiantum capillus-veneris]